MNEEEARRMEKLKNRGLNMTIEDIPVGRGIDVEMIRTPPPGLDMLSRLENIRFETMGAVESISSEEALDKDRFDTLLNEIAERLNKLEKWKVDSMRQWEAQARKMPSTHHHPEVLFKDDEYTIHDDFQGGVKLYRDGLLIERKDHCPDLINALKGVREELNEAPIPVDDRPIEHPVDRLCELVHKLYCMAYRDEDYVGSTNNARASKLYTEIIGAIGELPW